MARAATVLIVDDDSSMRQTMEEIVRSAGMRPLAVASGEEALRAVQSNPVDVMLLDVQMPGIGGLEVLRQVREKLRKCHRLISRCIITSFSARKVVNLG